MRPFSLIIGIWAVLLALPAAAQTRIPLDGRHKPQAVQPTERPAPSPWTAADTLQYRRLVESAYNALQNDSFAVGKERLEQALKVLPKMASNVEIYCELGQLEEREGRQRSALECYHRAIRFNKGYAKAYQRRAQMYLLLGQTDEAIADLDQTLRLSPRNDDARFLRACAHADRGHTALAEADFLGLLSLNPTDERANYGMALLELQKKEWSAAQARLNGLISRVPNDSRYYARRAEAEEALGETTAAATDWARATDLLPTDAILLRGHTLFLVRQGRRSEATALIDKAQRMGLPSEETLSLRHLIKSTKSTKKSAATKK